MALLVLAGREFRDHTRAAWLIALTGISVVLAPLTIYVGLLDYQRREAEHKEYSRRVEVERHAGRGLVGLQVEPALRVLREPLTASIFVRGLDDALPEYWDFSPAGSRQAPSGEIGDTVFESSTTFDLEFVIRNVLGLLAITLAAGTIARDRRAGVLKALEVLPVPAGTLFLGRLVGGVAALGAVTIAVACAALATLMMAAPGLLSFDLLMIVGLVCLISAVYLAALFAAGQVIGGLARTEATAVVAAVGTWVVLSLVSVPGAVFAGRAFVSLPAQSIIDTRIDDTYQLMSRDGQDELGDLLRQLIGDNVDIRAVRFEGAVRDTLEARMRAERAAIREQVQMVRRESEMAGQHQRALIEALALFSPGAQFLAATSAVAGTGASVAGRWNLAIQQHQAALEAALFDDPPRLRVNPPGPRGRSLAFFERREAPSPDVLPRFQPPDLALRGRVEAGLRPFAILIGYLALLLAPAVGACRYRPGRRA
jgi:ABC-type transport system involved in multi-copper enzyme maturation permease subunit